MGKCMRKAKLAVVMDVSQSSIGVRTRAKTLALTRLQRAGAAPHPSKPDSCYLELRSRRLEKSPVARQHVENYQNTPSPKHSFNCREREGSEIECLDNKARLGGSEIEAASFGENNLDSEAKGRSTKESTACSWIRACDTITSHGSTIKQTSPTIANQRAQNAHLRNMPTKCEIEEFFAREEQLQQRLFIEKYNFDIVTDFPLPGRYEWVKVMP